MGKRCFEFVVYCLERLDQRDYELIVWKLTVAFEETTGLCLWIILRLHFVLFLCPFSSLGVSQQQERLIIKLPGGNAASGRVISSQMDLV